MKTKAVYLSTIPCQTLAFVSINGADESVVGAVVKVRVVIISK